MKKFLKILILFLSINLSYLIISEKATAQTVNFQVFYDDLSPYGSWYESPQYGYIWSPRVTGFTPYSTGGYWVLTDVGWTWASDYSWGWGPFHYGRWYYDQSYGWVWVPGYEWGPGWVSWRRSDDYYGWAPIAPGISISVAYSSGYNVPYNNWHFVRCNDFGRRDIRNYYVDRSKNVTIINNTTVINNTRIDNSRRTTFNPGPDRAEVQKKVGRTINPVAIVDEKKPAQRVTKNNIQLYRPVVEENSNAQRKPAPAKIAPAKEQAKTVEARRDNETVNERQEKKINAQQEANRRKAEQQQASQGTNQPRKEQPQQNPGKKTIRDEQPTPVKRAPVEQSDKVRQQPERQQPERQQPDRKPPQEQQPPVQKPREEQPQRRETPQRVEQPPVQQPERPQRTERPPQEQRQQRTEQQPVRQQPEQRAMPQQNVERRQPVQQPRPERQQAPAPRPGKRGG